MKYGTILLAIIISMPLLTMSPAGTASSSSTFYVGGSGPGNYTTIQDAIDAASEGDIIYVYSGLYVENVLIYKGLTLAGDGAVIDGGDGGNTVHITANNTSLSGFYVRNSSDAGILIEACHVDITECLIVNNFYGIYTSYGGCDINIYHNNFVNNTHNAWDNDDATWDDGAVGNYWSDYAGSDANRDGIGDTPYDIGGGISRDNHPLLYRYGLPAAVFEYTLNGLEATFNGSFSVDYNGAIENYTWDFGDGNASYGAEVNHTYNKSGMYYVVLFVRDDGGRMGTSMKKVVIDIEAPVTSYESIPRQPNGYNNWYVSNIWFGFNASDSLSGVNYTKYNIDDKGWKSYEDYEVIEDDGYHYVHYYSVDKYGNEEDVKNLFLKIDKTPPYTMLDPCENESYWYRTDFIAILEGHDNMSGLATTYYRVNGGVFSTYTGPLNVTMEGISTLEYFSLDNAGNAERLKSVEVKIDKTAPDMVATSPKKSYLYVMGREILPLDGFDNFAIVIGGIDVGVDARDSTSGIQKIEFYVDNALRYTDNTPPYTWNWNETAIGPYTLKVRAYDVSGNVASVEIPVVVFNVQ